MVSQHETNLSAAGYDLRGLLALTSVAAFVSMVSQIELGLAIVFTAIFASCGLMANFNPVGTATRYRSIAFVFLSGLTSTCFVTGVQYFVFGSRPYLMWGTVLAAVFFVVILAIGACRPALMRWLKRIAISCIIITISCIVIAICYLALHCYLHRNEIYLTSRHVGYFRNQFAFTQGADKDDSFLNLLRSSVGLTDLYGMEIQHELSEREWKALFSVDSIRYVRFIGCKIDFPSIPLEGNTIDSLVFEQCNLRGQSIAAMASKSNATFILLGQCQVDSFRGLGNASKLQYLNLGTTPLTDELLEEILQLPKLQGLGLHGTVPTEIQYDLIRAKKPQLRVDLQ